VNGPEHWGIGVASAGLVVWGAQAAGAPLTLGTAIAGAVAAGIGALAPDIDHRLAFIGNRIPMGLMTVGLMLVLGPWALGAASGSGGSFAAVWGPLSQQVASLPKWGWLLLAVATLLLVISAAVTRSFDHRCQVHSLAVGGGATLVSLVVCLVVGSTPWLALLFGLGWLTHLMADSSTPDGLPYLFWPGNDPDVAGSTKVFGIFVIPLLLFGLTGWFVSGPSLLSSSRLLFPGASATPAGVPSVPAGAPVGANVSLARQRLTEASPEIASALTSPDSPVVVVDGARTSYAWEYLSKIAPNKVVVKTIKVTLDASGHLIGVDGS